MVTTGYVDSVSVGIVFEFQDWSPEMPAANCWFIRTKTVAGRSS